MPSKFQVIMKTFSNLFKIVKFIVLVQISAISNGSSVPPQVCVSKECNEAASLIISNMDARVDPCDDFYQFTCGRFKPPKTSAGKTRKNVDIFIIVEDEVMKQLLDILYRSSENKPLQLAAQYFNICRQDVTPPKSQMKLIHQKLSIFDGWPLTKWIKNHSWIETLQRLRSIGFGGSYMFRVDVEKHPFDRSKMLLQLIPPKLGFDPGTLRKGLSNADVQDYYKTWLNIAKEFNNLSVNPVKEKLLRKRLEEYVQFEAELARIVSSLDAPIKFEIVDVRTVENRYNSIKWSQVIQALAGPVLKISRSDKIIILPDFMVPLNKLLKKKSKKLINEFVIGRAIASSSRLMEYLQQTPREKFCLITASEKFTGALASRYIKEYFREDKRNHVDDMAQRVKTELYKSISHCDWLDRQSKSYVLEKLNRIKVIIGYSNEQLESDTFYNDIYKNFQINTKNSFESTLSLLKMEQDLVFGSLRNASLAKVVDPLNVFEVNGQYMPHENSVFIKAGALQGMFYSQNRPNYLNYGFVGFMIGHEFSHAFDPHNYKFSTWGKSRDWFTTKTKKKYNENKACLIQHYGQYSINGNLERVNGSRTLDENMADFEGIKSAYSAYNSWLQGKTEEKLSKLPYNNQQMFWISAATMWCSKFSTQGLTYLLENSIHSPPKARINALLSNIKEFSQDFHCPANAKMNPSKKCKLWR